MGTDSMYMAPLVALHGSCSSKIRPITWVQIARQNAVEPAENHGLYRLTSKNFGLGTEAGGGARRRANQGREAVCLVNAGLKSLAFDSGPPLICDELSVTYDPT